jgi:hypothetical protein
VIAAAGSAVFDTSVTGPSGYSDALFVTRNETNDLTTMMARIAGTASTAEDPPAFTDVASAAWYGITCVIRAAGVVDVPYEATPGALSLTGIVADTVETANVFYEATPGALVLAGQTADTVETQNVFYEATPGALLLAGQTADTVLELHVSYEATPGALVLTGQTADTVQDIFYESVVGSLSLAGQTADVLVEISYEATPGALSLTGIVADYVATADTNSYEATPGTLALAGQTADVSLFALVGALKPGATGLLLNWVHFGIDTGQLYLYQNADFTGLSDTMTITAQSDTQLTFSVPAALNNSQGTVYLMYRRGDGQWLQPWPATLEAGDSPTYEATAGALILGGQTLSGQVADTVLTTNVFYEATAGALVLTGQTADTVETQHAFYESVTGALRLIGQTADTDLAADVVYEASPGTLTLAGQTADVLVEIAYEATSGALLLAGQTADYVADAGYEAGAGALILTGQVGDVVFDTGYEATAGALALNGQAADLVVAIAYESAAGTLTLAGQTADFTITGDIPYEATPGLLKLLGVKADVTFPVETPTVSKVSGVRASYRSAYPRRVMIFGKRYTVRSIFEERRLFERLQAEEEAKLERASASKAEKVRIRIKRVKSRMDTIDQRDDYKAIKQKWEEDLIVLLAGNP